MMGEILSLPRRLHVSPLLAVSRLAFVANAYWAARMQTAQRITNIIAVIVSLFARFVHWSRSFYAGKAS